MTKKCVVCKLEPNPISTLTFHKFPKNEALKQKWISALQLTKNVNSNTTYVCSNHFHESDYFPTCEYRQRPRLLTDALPRLPSTPQSSSMLIIGEPTQQNQVVLNNGVSIKVEIDIDTENTLNSPTTLCHSTDSTENDNNYILPNDFNAEMTISCKRELPDTESQRTKRIRLTDGTRTELFSRRDFSSDESWSRFVTMIELKRRKQAADKQQRLRRDKKIRDLKEIVNALRG